MKIRKSTEKDFKGMLKVAKKLYPKWFNNFAINKTIPIDLKIQKGFVAEKDSKVVGFISYTSEDGEVVIGWIGVDPKFQNQGIGTKLTRKLEEKLNKIGVKKLKVETLDGSEDYKPYEATRSFYKNLGFKFKKIKRVKDKDTGEKFNLAVLIKKL